MKLLFKQRMFSWFDSYDVYTEANEKLYTVRGQLAWGHCLKIYDRFDCEVGMVKEKIFSFLPRYEIYLNGLLIGEIKKEFSFFKPKFTINYNGWQVEGSYTEWNYRIYSDTSLLLATVKKELWNFTDTYVIDVMDPQDALSALMLVIAIDAEKCSRYD